MKTGKQISDFLLAHQHDKIYVGVDGFVPRLVNDFTYAILEGHFVNNDSAFVYLHGPRLHTIDKISIEGSGSRGFTVEKFRQCKDGFWLVSRY